MTSLRYRMVWITAIFLALAAVALVLGALARNGALLSGGSEEKGDQGKTVAELQAERDSLGAKLAHADAFAGAVGPKAVAGQLAQRSVVMVTTEDAKPADRDAVKQLVAQSGARVTGEVQLTPAFTDPGKADQLREMVTRLQPAGAQFPTASDPGTLSGALLGTVLQLNRDTARPQSSPEELAAALSGLAGGGFIKQAGDVQPGQLSVVLAGGRPGGEAGDKSSTLARLATQLDRSGAGTVLAGDSDSASGTGPIGVARADAASAAVLSTVDDVDTSAGRVATLLALREQLEGRAGRYGTADNAQAAAPGIAGQQGG